MKYLALLRGINVGGNNRVPMGELRECFEKLGFDDVSTYINSGNIFFETSEKDETALVNKCEAAIEAKFGFSVVVMVISQAHFGTSLASAPKWWADGTEGIRSEALFVIPPTKASEVLEYLQKKANAPDKFSAKGQVIFWNLPMSQYSRSVVPKIIGTPIYKRVTIRNANTVMKLARLFNDKK